MELTKVKPNCPFLLPKNELTNSHFIKFCNVNLGVSPTKVIKDISKWLDEDHGSGDVTLFSSLQHNPIVNFFIVAKQDFVLSCLPLMQQTFSQTSMGSIKLYSDFKDSDFIKKNNVVLAGEGHVSSILLAERVALNICSKMSGVSTQTNKILSEIRKYSENLSLLETRKTTPGLRIYEKYSTRVGGGKNHRHGLDTGAMLKENHLRSIGSIEQAIDSLNKYLPILTKIEIEVSNLSEFRAALQKNVDVIMLDNFSLSDVVIAVNERNALKSNVKLELSGNLDEKKLSEICSLGLDYISMGALIHKATWVDMSLQVYST